MESGNFKLGIKVFSDLIYGFKQLAEPLQAEEAHIYGGDNLVGSNQSTLGKNASAWSCVNNNIVKLAQDGFEPLFQPEASVNAA
jgi:hypothetical protein